MIKAVFTAEKRPDYNVLFVRFEGAKVVVAYEYEYDVHVAVAPLQKFIIVFLGNTTVSSPEPRPYVLFSLFRNT